MQRLIEIAKSLRPGQRLHICGFNEIEPDGKRYYSPPLTEAQIYAYQDHIAVTVNVSEDGKRVFCIIVDKRELDQLMGQNTGG